MIRQNDTLSSTYIKYRKVNTKTEENFNPGLALIGLSGTAPRISLVVPTQTLPTSENTYYYFTTNINHKKVDRLQRRPVLQPAIRASCS